MFLLIRKCVKAYTIAAVRWMLTGVCVCVLVYLEANFITFLQAYPDSYRETEKQEETWGKLGKTGTGGGKGGNGGKCGNAGSFVFVGSSQAPWILQWQGANYVHINLDTDPERNGSAYCAPQVRRGRTVGVPQAPQGKGN